MDEGSVTISNNLEELKVKELKERKEKEKEKDSDDYSADSAESPEEGRKQASIFRRWGCPLPKAAASRYILAFILELRSSLPIMFRCPRNPPPQPKTIPGFDYQSVSRGQASTV